MVKEKYFVTEVDTDGVIADMDGSYTEHVLHIIPDFSEEKYIKSWSMPDIRDKYPEAHEIIQGLWRDPEFISNLPRFENVEEGMKKLCSIPGAHVVIHTHMFSETAGHARAKWLEQLREDTNTNFDIDICVGAVKKSLQHVDVTIEDNINNLNRSKAKIKFLIRRAHNRDYNVSDIIGADPNMAFVVNSFYEAVQKLEQIKKECLVDA